MRRCRMRLRLFSALPIVADSTLASAVRPSPRPRNLGEGSMKTAIVNLGKIVSGDWRNPFANGDSIVTDGGTIRHVGTADSALLAQCDVVIDADGATAIPGLIDSHVH